jgi:hypothetical protein
MSRLTTFTIAAVLTVFVATEVTAQEAVRNHAAFSNPGAFSFFNPYLDVLNGGAATPALKLSSDPAALQAYAARESGVGGSAKSVAGSPEQAFALSRPSQKHRHSH